MAVSLVWLSLVPRPFPCFNACASVCAYKIQRGIGSENQTKQAWLDPGEPGRTSRVSHE